MQFPLQCPCFLGVQFQKKHLPDQEASRQWQAEVHEATWGGKARKIVVCLINYAVKGGN